MKCENIMSVYAKNSTDRFGDDLTELILSYLTLEDKFRFECMSKQWKRCVFQRQFELDISVMKKQNSLNKLFNNNRHLSRERLISVLKKCPNLRKVKVCTLEKSDVVSLIGQHCPRLRSLSVHSRGIDMTFFRMCGHKIEELCIYGSSLPQSYLEFCPNLKNISIFQDSILLSLDKKFLPKLQRINSEFYIINENMNKIYTLSYKYSRTLKSLNVRLCDMTEQQLKNCFEYIACFKNLRQLKLTLSTLIKQPIDDSLSLIGQKCTKLLDLNFTCYHLISQQFFARFSEFKAIKRLNVQIRGNTILNASIQSLKDCKQLIHLAIDYNELREHFFINVNAFVPKLQSLRITTEIVFSDEFIDSFESMKNIMNVEVKTWNEKYKKSWVFDKCLSEVKSGPNAKAKQWQLRSRLL